MPTSPAQVLCTDPGTTRGDCRIAHIELPPIGGKGLATTKENGAVRGLSSLLANREEWLTDDAIYKALRPVHDGLPRSVRSRITIPVVEITGLFVEGDRNYDDLISAPKGGRRYGRVFQQFKETEYSLWPINFAGNHWELVFIHKKRVDGGEWSHILHIAVIDGWRDESTRRRKAFVDARLRRLFEKFNFTFEPNCERNVWAPWQKDTWSCGLRAYWAAKQMMSRILQHHEEGSSYDEELWLPLSGWFNPDFVRWEMIGLNAYHCVKELDYRARVAVELVNQVRSGDDGLVDAGKVMRPPKDDDEDIEEPPQPDKRRRVQGDDDYDRVLDAAPRKKFVPVPVPNQRRIAPSWSIKKGDYKAYERLGEEENPVWPWKQNDPPNSPKPKTSGTGSLFKD
ncbi:hypothetical protein F5Y13DRAFT_173763 [Hypoxylon sp. FL1857]|nr:hypothetical protein F5Y13DRAFT_173763 [Hypoxylon sp. FL1857]